MADGGVGFIGRCEVVEPRRGNRRWAADLKARIVAQSFQPGVRVVDVARRYGIAPHQLSDWRRHARQGLLALPADLLAAVSSRKDAAFEPAFVPLAITVERAVVADAPISLETVEVSTGLITLEIGADIVLRVPGDVAVERVAALVRAMRGAA